MNGTTLRDKTLELLRNRPATVRLKDIAEKTGISLPWIKSFHLGTSEGPSVVNVEILYEHLSGKKLKL